MRKVSVCMAVHNGELFLQEQLDSILRQLHTDDELVISDDGSTDKTLKIIKSYDDPRIHLLSARIFGNPYQNFEYALSQCRNNIIFLADQDDIWHPGKIKVMVGELASCDLAICDCRLIDRQGRVLIGSFFEWNNSQAGMIKNIFRNSFIGCCMAFHRRILKKVLPFPSEISIHDQWIGLMAMRHYEVKFIPAILVDHRRHDNNYSTTGGRSKTPWNKKVVSRLQLARMIWQH
jgi:glycosyltransferase involved in cell wall biosynthesis